MKKSSPIRTNPLPKPPTGGAPSSRTAKGQAVARKIKK